jgi:hypothetical protein
VLSKAELRVLLDELGHGAHASADGLMDRFGTFDAAGEGSVHFAGFQQLHEVVLKAAPGEAPAAKAARAPLLSHRSPLASHTVRALSGRLSDL